MTLATIRACATCPAWPRRDKRDSCNPLTCPTPGDREGYVASVA